MITIAQTLLKLKENKQKAFIPYITAGDPDLNATKKFVLSLAQSGADIIELGVPFSDPLADGPVNQRSSERSLKNKTNLQKILGSVEEIRSAGVNTPILLFSYLNPVFKMGFELFASKAAAAGVSGVLFVDLPPENASICAPVFQKHDLQMTFLLSPTTTEDRIAMINELSTGFVYYVSRTGVTGTTEEISNTLDKELGAARPKVTKSLCVGFGISNEQQARQVANIPACDGVIIGSAIVKIIEQNSHDEERCCQMLKDFSLRIKKAIS